MLEAWPLLVSALGLGLFGGLHCIGMCGGIVAAFGQASSGARAGDARGRGMPLSIIARSMPYHVGRIASYATAGAFAGFAGQALSSQLAWTTPLRVVAGLLLVAAGAYVAGWWSGLARLERLAVPVWRRISPLTRHFLPADTAARRLALGALWGWLPCGLVYSALVVASAAGDARIGAASMVAFGIGTLPSLWAASAVGRLFEHAGRKVSVRWGAGVALCVFGLWTMSGVAWMSHGHGAGDETCSHPEAAAHEQAPGDAHTASPAHSAH
jgi:hypothetical protein